MERVHFNVAPLAVLCGPNVRQWQHLRFRTSTGSGAKSRVSEWAHFVSYVPLIEGFALERDEEPLWASNNVVVTPLRQGVDTIGFCVQSLWKPSVNAGALCLGRGPTQTQALELQHSCDLLAILAGRNLVTLVAKTPVNHSDWK